jgi:hypothetical protein
MLNCCSLAAGMRDGVPRAARYTAVGRNKKNEVLPREGGPMPLNFVETPDYEADQFLKSVLAYACSNGQRSPD